MSQVRSWTVTSMALLLGAALLSAAEAQDRESGRRGPSATRSSRSSFLGLLSMEQVQKELKINDDQAAKLKDIGEKLWAEMREQYAGLREIEDRQKQREKMIELREKFDDDAHGQIRDVLAREQMMRLYQVRLQVRGDVYGLNNRYVAARLKLTDEQKKKAANIEKALQEKTSKAYSGLRDLSQEERRQKYGELRETLRKIRDQADKQALGLLTAEQKEALEAMKGKKLEL